MPSIRKGTGTFRAIGMAYAETSLMSRSCPTCQAALTPKSRFCPACGTATPLTETLATAQVPTAPADHASGSSASPPPQTVAHEASASSAPTPAPATTLGKSDTRTAESTPAPTPAARIAAAAKLTRSPFGGDDDCAFALWLNFPHALVEGHAGTLMFRIENDSPAPIENIELYASSRGLSGETLSRARRVAPGARHDVLAEVEATRSGHFVLQIAASWDQGGQRYAYQGRYPLRIYKAPDNSNIVINIGDIQSNTGGGANQALGAEYGDVQISNLIEKGAIKTVNDLLDLELPENWRRVDLELDYEVSRYDSGFRSTGSGLQIPPALLATVQPATLCVFESSGPGAPPLPLKLVARPQFRLGRARAEADFVAWVLPRSPANDEKSLRVSKVHAIAELTAQGITVRDNASANGTLFDNVPLDENGTSLPRQGRLQLAGAVELDFDRIAPVAEQDPIIGNVRAWNGPAAKPPTARGAVRFEVVADEPQPLNAVWLLSDTAFGSSHSNAITLPDDAVAEVQGRFYHFRGCFWIETLAANSAVQLDHLTLRPGEIAPLATGQQLRVGTRTWRVKLEA